MKFRAIWFAILTGLSMVCIANLGYAQSYPYIEDSIKYGQGKVYQQTEKPADFMGSVEAIQDYFETNFDIYAESGNALEGAKEGKVVARFIIEPNGKVSNVEILQKYTPAYDQEMERVLLKMPKWKPALIGGKPVRSFFTYSYQLNFYMK